MVSRQKIGGVKHLGPDVVLRQPPNADTLRHLALKLKLTSLALGCSTNKELCARFASSNPATRFIPQNAYKWLSGKAMPRESSVYEDWAQVLGGALSAPFLASSTFEEFQHAIRSQFDLPETILSALKAEAGLAPSSHEAALASPPPRIGEPPVGEHWLEGSYLAISPAWSRTERGRLILGAVDIRADATAQLQLSYRENLGNRQVFMRGHLLSDGRSAQSPLTCSYTHRLIFLALNLPAPPANLIGGILSGAAVHDADAQATASRILLLRAQGGRAEVPGSRTGYLCADGLLVADELAALGYHGEAARQELGHGIIAALGAGSPSCLYAVAPADLAPLAAMLDQLAFA